MRISITGKNMDVSNALHEIINKKIGKLDRYLKPETDVYVTLSVEPRRHIIEVTIPINGLVLRAQEVTDDMYTSIDNVLEKLERQMRKHRTKLDKRLRDGAFREAAPVFIPQDKDESDEGIRIVKSKRFAIKPMDPEEAVMQMELLGHDFFVFMNMESEQVCVVYRRKGGDFGLIEPEYE